MGIAIARRRRALIIVPAAGALFASAFVGLPAHAAVTGPIDCPMALPTADAVKGLIGTGYTVSEGTDPEPFTATVLGRIKDGIGPGVDMIMADLDSPALDAAGGVWAGMSGSPVYTDDGDLIGAVSYGLAASSPIAGITPAATMTPLLTGDTPTSGLSTGAGLPKQIHVSSSQAKSLAKTGGLALSTTSRGFKQLTLPVGVSGAPSRAGQKILDRFEKRLGNVSMFSGGGTATAQVSAQAVSDVHAAGNFAGMMSYGDASFYGVGTTTFVCNGRAVAFGHPFDYTGDTTLGANLADAIYVQPDPIFGPFKVANIGETVGTVDLDSLTGIAATLGDAPANMAAVTTTLKNDAGKTFTGGSDIVTQDYTPDIAAYTAQFDIERALGASGKGSASLTIEIKGKRASGAPFTVTHKDKFVSNSNLPYTVADTVYLLAGQLSYQELEKVSITSINITGTVSKVVRGYRASNLQVKKGSKWVKPGSNSFVVKSGGTLATRLTLSPLNGSASITRELKVALPSGLSSGDSGSLTVVTGSDPWMWDFSEAETFSALLKQLNNLPTSTAIRGDTSFSTYRSVKSRHSERVVSYAITSYVNGADLIAN